MSITNCSDLFRKVGYVINKKGADRAAIRTEKLIAVKDRMEHDSTKSLHCLSKLEFLMEHVEPF